MSPVTCSLCGLTLMCGEDPEVEGQVVDLHLRTMHPHVTPWLCRACRYGPPVTLSEWCFDMAVNTVCPKYKERPAGMQEEAAMIAVKCRVCGCDELHACLTDDGPCFWVEPGLCSACDDKLGQEEEAANGQQH